MIIAVIVILTIVFVVLAWKNWRRVIGAGPTILIVGMVLLMGLLGLQLAAFTSATRTYDACHDRVDRSIATHNFNKQLVKLADDEGSPEIAHKLASFLNPELSYSSCGNTPTFLNAGRDLSDKH